MRAANECYRTIYVAGIRDMVDHLVAALEGELEVKIAHTHLQQFLSTDPQPATRRIVHVHKPVGVSICNENRFTCMVHDCTKLAQLLFTLVLARHQIGQLSVLRGKPRDLRPQRIDLGPELVFSVLPFGDVLSEERC